MIKGNAVSLSEIKKKFSDVVRKSEAGEISIVLKRSKPTSAIISFEMLRKLLGDEAVKELLFNAFVEVEIENRVTDAIEGKNVLSENEAKKRLGWK